MPGRKEPRQWRNCRAGNGRERPTFGFRVVQEDLEAVNKVRARERVAADTNAEGLSQPGFGGLVDGLVGQGARTRHDADDALFVDVAGHDAELAFARLD